jgi:two-component system, LytTR family, response regulator
MNTDPMDIRAVIVEDEPHARQRLREYVTEVGGLELIGEAADGIEAARLIDRLEPDLVLLARIRHRPDIVFTTAHDRFALDAFEAGALDYLLKPFGRGRFERMLERVRRRMEPSTASAVERARAVLGSSWRRLFARTATGIVPIDVGTIRRIAASGDYVEVHCGDGHHLLQIGLGELMARLDPERFCRVHRSHIVNLDQVERLSVHDERRLLVELRGGERILASRSASERLRRLAL